MTRKQSKYRPKPIIGNPLIALRPVPAVDREKLLATCRSALTCMSTGRMPGVDDWVDLANAVNIIDTLAMSMRKLVVAEVLPTLNAAQEALVRASDRHKEGLAMRLDGAGMEALRDIIDMYEQCLIGFTALEMSEALTITRKRVLAHGTRARKDVLDREAACT